MRKAVGEAIQFVATAYDSTGDALRAQAMAWSSTNVAVATVTSTGTATAREPGLAWVAAWAGGKSGTAVIAVDDPANRGGPGGDSAVIAGRTVAVAPARATLASGGTQQLVAVVRDLPGAIIVNAAVAWSSRDTSIATVAATGLVTAVARGVATITASAAGSSASATITVVDTGVPLPAAWPHAPPAYPPVSDQPFDLVTALNWAATPDALGLVGIALDPTGPLSPAGVLQFTYPAGYAGGSAPSAVYHPLANLRQVYAGMWWRTNASWQGHDSEVNKIAFLYADGSAGNMYLCFYGPPAGPFETRVALQFAGADRRFWLVPNAASLAVSRGDWHRLEWLVRYNTSSSPPNGVVRWWLDGTLVGDYHDVRFPSRPLVEFQLSPTWGGTGGTKAATDYLRFDHLFLSGR